MQVVLGDITQLSVDAIVNAANSQLAGGGGVDGAIHRAAGYEQLHQACGLLDGCPTGQVKVTEGFNLPTKYIFHAVGPIWQGGTEHEAQLLASCYRNAMILAKDYEVHSIAFPAISCGIYGYPVDGAVVIAVREVRNAVAENPAIENVIFCCFDEAMANTYEVALAQLN
ncbi:MAG: O-acetyl-ADP-ribose deacetylase [Porticoccus sp.]